MLEVTIGVVAFVVGIVAGVLGERRRVAQVEARRKAAAYKGEDIANRRVAACRATFPPPALATPRS